MERDLDSDFVVHVVVASIICLDGNGLLSLSIKHQVVYRVYTS